MYYSAIGFLAILILLIENHELMFSSAGAFEAPSWSVYRRFLFAVLACYITDTLWGILEFLKLQLPLFADTTVYFMAMGVGVLFWVQFTVAYLEKDSRFGRFLIYVGCTVAGLISLLALANIFVPILFTVDANCVYHARPIRYIMLCYQILLLMLISVYAITSIFRHTAGKRNRYRTLALFGLIMALFLLVQLWFPYLPLYTIAYMLGTCLLHTFVVNEEKDEYRRGMEDAEKIKELKQSITSLLDNMPAITFSKDGSTGKYLACNQSFADYVHRKTPEDVVGLTAEQLFDKATAERIAQDDRIALSMDTPYIFFEEMPDDDGSLRQLQTTKLKFIDGSGRLCTLGMSQDVTDMVRIRRENAMTKEAYEKALSSNAIFTHIAQTLAHGYTDLYYVNMDTEEFIEYHAEKSGGALTEVRRDFHFFESCKNEAELYVFPDDREKFVNAMNRRRLADALEKNNTFMMTYRRLVDGQPRFVSMKVSRMEDDSRFTVIGVTDVDDQVKHRLMEERINEERIVYARLQALTGNFICVYVVDPATGSYREFSATDGFEENFAQAKGGTDFFGTLRGAVAVYAYPEDRDRVLSILTQENVMADIESAGIFTLGYRIMMNGRPVHFHLKAAMVEEKEGPRLIVGLNDIDAQVRQEEEQARRLEQAQHKANIDALTGVKNRHAFLDAEEKIDRRIAEHRQPEFAIVMLDVNDLKKVNDSEGHQAGDQYLRDASKIITDIFKNSPVFRIGGDEFVVIVQGSDYSHIDRLIERMNGHNDEAGRTGGIVIACGMARHERDDCVAPVFERADHNMYANKIKLKAQRQ